MIGWIHKTVQKMQMWQVLLGFSRWWPPLCMNQLFLWAITGIISKNFFTGCSLNSETCKRNCSKGLNPLHLWFPCSMVKAACEKGMVEWRPSGSKLNLLVTFKNHTLERCNMMNKTSRQPNWLVSGSYGKDGHQDHEAGRYNKTGHITLTLKEVENMVIEIMFQRPCGKLSWKSYNSKQERIFNLSEAALLTAKHRDQEVTLRGSFRWQDNYKNRGKGRQQRFESHCRCLIEVLQIENTESHLGLPAEKVMDNSYEDSLVILPRLSWGHLFRKCMLYWMHREKYKACFHSC